ncbi:MAG TPA: hypothetical protein PJ994_03520, partial [Tepidiformaceae bacterium]|nr:hypothetical protein [Tepidiformaceae bacterium]
SPTDSRFAMMERELTAEQWGVVEAGIDRIVKHPIWTADLALSDRTRAVETALLENRDANKAFDDVRLRSGYVSGIDELPSEWYQ